MSFTNMRMMYTTSLDSIIAKGQKKLDKTDIFREACFAVKHKNIF